MLCSHKHRLQYFCFYNVESILSSFSSHTESMKFNPHYLTDKGGNIQVTEYTQTDTPSVQIVILNWNGKEDTIQCLDSLKSLSYPRYGITVVDNGSTDGSVEMILESANDIENFNLIETGENLGFAGGNNVGVKTALENDADYVLILNNDTIVEESLLEKLVNRSVDEKDNVILGPSILLSSDSNRLWFAGANWNNNRLGFDFPLQDEPVEHLPEAPILSDYVCGAAMFFHHSIPERVGLMDDRFFLVWEESDWCFQMRKLGIRSLIVPEARIWHKVGASFGSESSPLRAYYSFRNRLLWAEKNLDRLSRLEIIFRSLRPFFPRLSIPSDHNTHLLKRLLWSLSGWYNTRNSLFLKTKRKAFIDYLFRNFGECPKQVVDYHSEWIQSNGPEINQKP